MTDLRTIAAIMAAAAPHSSAGRLQQGGKRRTHAELQEARARRRGGLVGVSRKLSAESGRQRKGDERKSKWTK